MDPQRVDSSKELPIPNPAHETVGNSSDCFESRVPKRESSSQDVGHSVQAEDLQFTGSGVPSYVPADEPRKVVAPAPEPSRYRRHQTDPLGVAGKVLNDRYEVTAYLSRGSFGYVYRGKDRRFDRGDDSALVAIKFMQLTSQNRSGFEREAQLMKRFHHPHFVDVYDFGEDDEGFSWLVMEYLAGRTLDDLLRHADGPADLSLVIKFAEQVLPAMNSAHRKNLIHRDLKPANIMVVDDGGVDDLRFKIMDFGTSAQIDATDTLANQTMKSAGTPMFMAPEQVTNAISSPKSDLYSIGVILFQMLSGKLPFELKSVPKVLHDVVYTAPPKLSAVAPRGSVPRELDRLIGECLSKSAAARPADLNVVRDRLLRILQSPSRRSGFGLHAIRAVAVIGLVGVIAAFTNFWDRIDFARFGIPQREQEVVQADESVEQVEQPAAEMPVVETPIAEKVVKTESVDSIPTITQSDTTSTELSPVQEAASSFTELPVVARSGLSSSQLVSGVSSAFLSASGVTNAIRTSGAAVSLKLAGTAPYLSAISTMEMSWTPPTTNANPSFSLVEVSSPTEEAVAIEEDFDAGEPADAMLVENAALAEPPVIDVTRNDKSSNSPTKGEMVREQVSPGKGTVPEAETSEAIVKDDTVVPVADVEDASKMSDAERARLERENAEYAAKLNNGGVELQSVGKHTEAIDVFDTAIRLDPKQTLAYANRGGSRLHLGDLAGAVEDFNEAIALDPKNVEAHINRGDARRQLGQIEKALADLNFAIELDASRAEAFNNRSLIHRHKGDLKSALADCEKSIALSPKAAEYFNNRGNVHREMGELDKAIKDYSEAFKLNPVFATALVNRGMARRQLGDQKHAMDDFRMALFFDPLNKAALKELESLKEQKSEKK